MGWARHGFAMVLAPAVAAIAMAVGSPDARASGRLTEVHKLRLRNDCKTPDEVVAYYVGRDSDGFVWSGFDKTERAAFTIWDDSPSSESFLVARKYEIQPARWPTKEKDEAVVEVRYEILGMADAFGTVTPWAGRQHKVDFVLRKVGNQWKIAEPGPSILPVMLLSQFRLDAGSKPEAKRDLAPFGSDTASIKSAQK